MPEIYRTFIVVFGLGFATFWVAGKNLPTFLSRKEFDKWRNLWLSIVIIGFFSPDIWFFSLILIAFLAIFIPKSLEERLPLYFLVLFILPELKTPIPGIFGINQFFELSYPRLLALCFFLIPFLTRRKKNKFYSSVDKWVILYLIIIISLNFRDTSFTNALRELFILMLDIFLPFFFISKSVRTLDQLNRIMFALFIGLMPILLIGCFESLKHWKLYGAVLNSLTEAIDVYDVRSGTLRASGPFSSPLVLGFISVASLGIFLYLKPFFRNKKMANLFGIVIVFCLISTLARGSWLGGGVLAYIFLSTGRSVLKSSLFLSLIAGASFTLLNMTEYGKKLIDLIPFVGNSRSDTIEYRERLLENAWIVFQKNPMFGSTKFLETEEMESMRQGQGIIDLVNAYIQVALPYGGIGVFVFVVIFLGLLIGCYRTMKTLPVVEVELIRMGRALFATLVSALFIIFTVSSIDYIPVMYWSLAGIMSVYIHISKQTVLTRINADRVLKTRAMKE